MKIKKITFRILMLFIVAAFNLCSATKTQSLSFYDLVAKSDTIIIGTVLNNTQDSVQVTVDNILKGESNPRAKSIDKGRIFRGMYPKLLDGDKVIAFFKKENGLETMFAGFQGLIKLEAGEFNQYRDAVQFVLQFETDKSSSEKEKTIIKMLKSGNPLIEETAILGILYSPERKKGFPLERIRKHVVQKIKAHKGEVAKYYVWALCEVGEKKDIPLLIDLIDSENDAISAAALTALDMKLPMLRHSNLSDLDKQQVINANSLAIPKLSSEEKAGLKRAIQDWWEIHKASATIKTIK